MLQASGTPEAREALRRWSRNFSGRVGRDLALVAHADRVLRILDGHPEPADRRKKMDKLVESALNAPARQDRIKALRKIAEDAFVEAIPALRVSLAGDVSGDVREEAAYALARVGDIDSVDRFARMLRGRATDPGQAKVAAHALGMLGDLRGVHELLAAWAEGWQPGIVAEAVRHVGSAALDPLVSLLEANPALIERKAALGIVSALPSEDVAELLVARLDANAGTPVFVERAGIYVTLAGASSDETIAKRVAQRVLEVAPEILDKKSATREEKALARRCEKVIA